jgi:SAM-dependent methyltransferase
MRNINISKSDEDLLSEYYTQCSWPKAYYSNLTNLARLTQGKRILEVGVAYGYHADYILENLPGSLYTGIDPYLANYDIDDAFSRDVSQIFHDDPQAAMDRLYIAVCNRLNHKHKDRFKILRESSKIALSDLDTNSFDIIFIVKIVFYILIGKIRFLTRLLKEFNSPIKIS